MIMVNTSTIPGHKTTEALGLVRGSTIRAKHLGKDILASFTNIVGGRSNAYESTLRETRDDALAEMMEEARKLGANAIVGTKFDYTVIGQGGSMMMVAVSGTAVSLV